MKVAILIHESRFKKYRALVRRVVLRGLKELKLGEPSVTLVLTNDAEIRKLNHDFRGKNKPTNVLSFPDGEAGHLGDIVLAYGTIRAEAKEQKKKFEHHLTHLLLHGLLHLLGHDHEKDKDAKRMESLEIKLLAGMGIANPYRAH